MKFTDFDKQTKQGESERIDQFYTRLRSLSKNCEFSDVNFEIMVQIVVGGKSSRTRKQALRDPKYTLTAICYSKRDVKKLKRMMPNRKVKEGNTQIGKDKPNRPN